MHIKIFLHPQRLWSWHHSFLSYLNEIDNVTFHIVWKKGQPQAAVTKKLLKIDRRLDRRKHAFANQFKQTDFIRFERFPATHSDLTINLTHSIWDFEGESEVITPLYNGLPDDKFALIEILQNQSPCIGFKTSAYDAGYVTACASLATPDSLSKSLNEVFVLVQTTLEKIISSKLQNISYPFTKAVWPINPLSKQKISTANLIAYSASRTSALAWRWFKQRLETPRIWSLNAAILKNPDPTALCAGKKFCGQPGQELKEPFLFHSGGEVHLFFTLINTVNGRSSIGYLPHFSQLIESSEQVQFVTPLQVLERPYQVSHPFIFEWNGQIYMIPFSANGQTELYRAKEFPTKWVYEKNIFEDFSLANTTIWKDERNNNQWWAYGNIKRSDQNLLNLYSFTDPLSKWSPHNANPVNLDSATNIPAGVPFVDNDQIIAPMRTAGQQPRIQLSHINQLDKKEFELQALHRKVMNISNWRIDNASRFGYLRNHFACDCYSKTAFISDIAKT